MNEERKNKKGKCVIRPIVDISMHLKHKQTQKKAPKTSKMSVLRKIMRKMGTDIRHECGVQSILE
jgi:hypothetical protein